MTAREDDIERLRELGAGKPASAGVAGLYAQAFREFGAQYLWSYGPSGQPTFTQTLRIAETLRREGNSPARALAVQIEEACRAELER